MTIDCQDRGRYVHQTSAVCPLPCSAGPQKGLGNSGCRLVSHHCLHCVFSWEDNTKGFHNRRTPRR